MEEREAGERKKCLTDIGAFSSYLKPLSSHSETMVLKYLSPFRISLPGLNLSSLR